MRRVTPKPFPSDPVLSAAKSLGAHVRAARTQSGLTLEEAALSVGVAKQTMQNIETDPTTVSFGVVLAVARALGVSLFAFPAQQQEPVRRLVQSALPDANGASLFAFSAQKRALERRPAHTDLPDAS